jgi:hypothetical protein
VSDLSPDLQGSGFSNFQFEICAEGLSEVASPPIVSVMLASIGVQSIVHPEAELAASRAAAAQGVPFLLSTAASHSIEQVAEAMGRGAVGTSSTGRGTGSSQRAS